MVNAYNAANGTAIQALPRSLWSIPAELIIKEGDRFTLGDITITNTLGLNTFKQYAVGLTIIAASGSNKIADNLKNLFIIFRIQNQYDGKYSMIGQFYHPTLEPTFAHHNLSIELHTSGPNSVKIYWPIAGQYTIPMTTNGGQPFFIPGTSQGQEPEITIDPVSYAANCNNNFPGSVTFYKPIPAYDGNTYINRWDPATRTIFLAFGYNLGPGGTFIPNVSRAWIDTLTYLGPR
jgi:hypothetical protein